jgi:hypothetical protein
MQERRQASGRDAATASAAPTSSAAARLKPMLMFAFEELFYLRTQLWQTALERSDAFAKVTFIVRHGFKRIAEALSLIVDHYLIVAFRDRLGRTRGGRITARQAK